MEDVTMLSGNLAMDVTGFGFSNSGGLGNLGVATSSVSVDQFNQLQSTCKSLEAQVREL